MTLGNCTMRVRITYTGALDPCGVTSFGEVEDYTLNITSKVPNVWTGNFNNYWGNAPNWSLEHVPTADEDVIIPNVNMPCIVDFTAKSCNDLTLYSGATLLVSANTLNVNGIMDLYGTVAMDNVSGVINSYGNVYWQSGSSANFTANSVWWAYGDYWEFRSGSNVQFANGVVDFTGSSHTAIIRNYSSASNFNNLGTYSTDGSLWISGLSTQDLTISGYLYINTGATFNHYSSNDLVLKGMFYNNNHFNFSSGTLVMNGAYSQYIKPNTGDALYNLTVNSAATVWFDNTYVTTLPITKNLVIQSGYFNPMNNTVTVGGDWSNLIGPSAFIEGSGRVIINGGNYHQYCSNETFNILEVNKTLGGAFRMNGSNVVCAAYDWTAGAVDVLSGSFTANDLLDSGLYGNYYVNPGGTINLHNTDGWVDLNGYIYIYGGNFNVYGGSGSDSYWPYSANGGITISDGVLDFKDVGVYVYNTSTYTFTENITGGTIRTSRGFGVNRADYTPDAGTIEFYGPADGSFYTLNGGYVRNVIINKAAADNSGSVETRISRDRQTGEITDVPLANTITLGGNADVNGNVTIQAGVLSAGTYTINVEGNWDNQVGTAGFAEGTGIVWFDGLPYSEIVHGETFYNMYESKTNTDFNALELMPGMTLDVTNNLWLYDGSLELDGGTILNSGVDLEMGSGAGINANDYPAIAINVAGDWSNGNTDYDIYHGFDPGYYSTVTFNGTANQTFWTNCPQEDFYNLTINKTGGEFRAEDNTRIYGNLLIQQGTWEDFLAGLTHTVYGDFTVASAGSFLTTSVFNTVEFAGNQNSNLTYAGLAGYFHHILVNKGVGYSVLQTTNVSTQFGGNLTIGSGTYNQNGHSLNLIGDIAVNNTGILSLPAASVLSIGDTKTLNVNSGGRIDIAGTSGSPVNIKANVAASKYSFNVNSGGIIAADYCVFKNMGVSGVNVKSGGSIDISHSFKGCIFQDGASGGTLLTIDNSETRTIRNAVFPSNTWAGASNVTKSVNAGFVYFVDYSGGFSGENYDNDVYNRVQWVPTLAPAPTAAPTAICAGSSAVLNANVSGGIAPYTYIWTPATGLSNQFVSSPVASPASTTSYSVNVTDALGTSVTGGPATLTVNPILPAGVSISASANPSPPGSYVLFTATPVNGGATPSYQWKINGVNAGSGLSTYSYVPAYNDHVTCVMTSNYSCPSGNPATSNSITMIVVATNNTVTGTVPSPLNLCFDATNTITVAGGGTTFVLQPGAAATMIAGMKISYLTGAMIKSGAYMHGYITSTNAYCGSAAPPMVAVTEGTGEQAGQVEKASGFVIYPNPTTGKFTLVDRSEKAEGITKVEIFGIRGDHLGSEMMINERFHEFNISGLPAGMYFIRAVKGETVETFKLILSK